MENSINKAYTEVYKILQFLGDEYINRIPNKFIEYLKENKDNDYIAIIDPEIPLQEQGLLVDTISILALLKRDYWCKNIEKLRKGTYTITEKSAPSGYLLDTKEYNVEIKVNQTTTQAVVNVEPTGTITIIKKDARTDTITQGDATFNGAIYKVYAKEDIYNKSKTRKFYSKDDLVATRTMNEKGQTEDIKDLPLGKYVVKEDVAPKGYMLDTKEYEVELKYKDQNTKIISSNTTSLVDDTQVEEQDSSIAIDFENKKIETPKTGDSSYVKLAIGVAILALLGLVWLFIKIFKKN